MRCSASQAETYALCARKWGWRYLDGIRSPPGPAQALGDRVHKVLEAWLRDGTAPDPLTKEGAIATAGLHLLPAPRTVRVEGEFGLEMGATRWIGYKDFQSLTGTRPLVGDHKTTGDFRWMKTPEELRTNYQAALYAADAMHRTGADACDLTWVYYRTRGAPAAKRVHLRVTRSDVAPTLERLVTLASEMSALEAGGCKAMDLPPNASACGAFGGCEHVDRCNLSPGERMQSHMSQAERLAGLLSRVQGAKGINPPAPAPEPAAPAPSPEPAPAAVVAVGAGGAAGLLASLKKAVAGPADRHDATPAPAPSTPPPSVAAPAPAAPTLPAAAPAMLREGDALRALARILRAQADVLEALAQ